MLPAALSAGEWRVGAADRLREWLKPEVQVETGDCDDLQTELRNAVSRFYALRGYQTSWVDRFGLLPSGKMALETVGDAAAQGLRSMDYQSPLLENMLNNILTKPVVDGAAMSDSPFVQLDLALTETLLRYARDVTRGRVVPEVHDYTDKDPTYPPRDLAQALAAALDGGGLETFLRHLGPPHQGYHALQDGLQRYRAIQTRGGWPSIDPGPTMKIGDRELRVAMLRYRLSLTGDMHLPSGVIDDHFDEALEEVVKHFQRRHGLTDDGFVGKQTLKALNVPVEQRVRQIQLNMERWRWVSEDLGDLHLRVNVPAFKLEIVERGQVVETLRAIVGRRSRPTPVLSSAMTYLEINPYWHVPSKIAREDLLPKIQEDPFYIVRQGFRIFEGWAEGARELNPYSIDWSVFSQHHFPLRLRQDPAAHNALGRIKFIFPNDLAIYIHDTPSKNLFQEHARNFSSGCVRVEEPLALASYLLERQGWDQERLQDTVASEQRRVVKLKEAVPVHLVYFTAWVSENGDVHFRKDIYGRDRRLTAAMDRVDATTQSCNIAALSESAPLQAWSSLNSSPQLTGEKSAM
jgi:murein L,D-transpeptidase YcbB/YkuD